MTRDEWADALIALMGWATGVRDGIVAQASAENSQAQNNPLDTTRDWPGATQYNAAGVKNYATTADGLDATKATLLNGLYANMLAAGAQGDASGYVNACAHSPWGTWSDQAVAQSMLAGVLASPAYGQVEVAGSGSAPTPPPPPAPPPSPPTQQEIDMHGWTSPDGATHVVGKATDDGNLLEFTQAPGGPWIVTDVTDAIHNENPSDPRLYRID